LLKIIILLRSRDAMDVPEFEFIVVLDLDFDFWQEGRVLERLLFI